MGRPRKIQTEIQETQELDYVSILTDKAELPKIITALDTLLLDKTIPYVVYGKYAAIKNALILIVSKLN